VIAIKLAIKSLPDAPGEKNFDRNWNKRRIEKRKMKTEAWGLERSNPRPKNARNNF